MTRLDKVVFSGRRIINFDHYSSLSNIQYGSQAYCLSNHDVNIGDRLEDYYIRRIFILKPKILEDLIVSNDKYDNAFLLIKRKKMSLSKLALLDVSSLDSYSKLDVYAKDYRKNCTNMVMRENGFTKKKRKFQKI